MIGKQLRITVARTDKSDKAYNNITEVLPAKIQVPPIEANIEPIPEPQNTPAAPRATIGYDNLKAVADKLSPKSRS